jgi:predicted RNA-binding protein (virulence factor B family)
MLNEDIIGTRLSLKIVRSSEPGIYLDGGELGEILLPNRYVEQNFEEGDEIGVFVYFDAKNRLIATTLTPKIERDCFAILTCKEVSQHGAFMDWGVEAKDLFIPFKEQKTDVEEGKNYVVYCYYDHNTNRLVGSTKVNRFLDLIPADYEPNQAVDVLITGVLEIGYTCIINNVHSGMIYHNEIYEPIRVGNYSKAWIKKVREDDKIDVSIHPLGVGRFQSKTPSIIEFLNSNDGVMFITDKSDPELIRTTFAMSKKAFKKALGLLYKDRLIDIQEDRIVLLA